MSNLKDGKSENREAASQNPPPYSAKQSPYEPPKSVVLPAPPVDHGAAPPMPNQYQVYCGPPGEGSGQIPVLQASQAIFITAVQPTHEPDYLIYSSFTTLCCFPILGVAALIFSIQARRANSVGNGTLAHQNSQRVLILAHSAVGVGIAFYVMYLILQMYIFHWES